MSLTALEPEHCRQAPTVSSASKGVQMYVPRAPSMSFYVGVVLPVSRSQLTSNPLAEFRCALGGRSGGIWLRSTPCTGALTPGNHIHTHSVRLLNNSIRAPPSPASLPPFLPPLFTHIQEMDVNGCQLRLCDGLHLRPEEPFTQKEQKAFSLGARMPFP